MPEDIDKAYVQKYISQAQSTSDETLRNNALYLLRTANINASNRKQGNFETTLTANKRGLQTTIIANETTLFANKPQ